MNLWLLACLVTCFVGTWPPTVQAQGIFEDCCLAYHPRIRLTVLRHALSYMYQDVSGSCNLPAVIFYFRHRQTMVCGNPQAKWVQNGMKLLDTLTKALPKRGRGTRRTFQGSHILGEELSSGTSSLPRSTFRGHPRSSEKNASLPTTATPGKDLDHVTVSRLIMMKALWTIPQAHI
uniref:C-C motif chemokine 25 n=2 Tax=Molossus molossus TaxID=27622 RepID=A0A7J8I5E6_MOLMO|nr:C-C motif chemokine ligand 25 [Molossus molossus]